jgi:hypothetical protein
VTTSTSVAPGKSQAFSIDQNGTRGLTGATVEHILVFPTVTDETLNLRIASDTCGNVRIGIYDINGRMVDEQQTTKQGTYLNKSFSVGRLPAGMYIMQVVIGDRKRMAAKFVKQ